MIWLKSVGMGLVAVLIFAVISTALVMLVLTFKPPDPSVAFTTFVPPPLMALYRLSMRLMLAAVFVLGFSWELWRLGR